MIEVKKKLIQRQLQKQYEIIFNLMDVHKLGLVPQSEIVFNLVKLQEMLPTEVDLSVIPNFDSFQND